MGSVLLLGTCLLVGRVHGQAPAPTAPSGLQEELEKARREIERLQAENARLRGERNAAPATPDLAPTPVPPPTPAVIAAPTPPSAVPPPITGGLVQPASGLIVLPAPVADGETVRVEQLLADYRASAVGGDARYKGRRLRLAGTVRSFKKVFVSMSWDVQLEAGDALGVVRCRTTFPGISDFRGEGGSILEGRRPFRAWQTLLSKGDPVVLEARCEGLDGAVIAFKEGRPVDVATP